MLKLVKIEVVLMLQEARTSELLREVEELEKSSINFDQLDKNPELNALQTANSKLKYQILHLQRVCYYNLCWDASCFSLALFLIVMTHILLYHISSVLLSSSPLPPHQSIAEEEARQMQSMTNVLRVVEGLFTTTIRKLYPGLSQLKGSVQSSSGKFGDYKCNAAVQISQVTLTH